MHFVALTSCLFSGRWASAFFLVINRMSLLITTVINSCQCYKFKFECPMWKVNNQNKLWFYNYRSLGVGDNRESRVLFIRLPVFQSSKIGRIYTVNYSRYRINLVFISYAKNLTRHVKTHRMSSGPFGSPCNAGAGGCQVSTGYVLLPFNTRRRFPNLQRTARIRTRKIIATRRKLGDQIHAITRHIRFLCTAWLFWLITILWQITHRKKMEVGFVMSTVGYVVVSYSSTRTPNKITLYGKRNDGTSACCALLWRTSKKELFFYVWQTPFPTKSQNFDARAAFLLFIHRYSY